jgi:hypothetical protein
MDDSIRAYNGAQDASWQPICEKLATEIDRGLDKAQSKVWHGGPVWFIDGNPVAGYWVRKSHVRLLFWSGQSFDEPGLDVEGKFKAAHAKYTKLDEVKPTEIKRWLAKAQRIQWDYRNLIKRKGRLEKLGDW